MAEFRAVFRFRPFARRAAACALAAAFALLLTAGPAQAQSATTFVKNTDQTLRGGSRTVGPSGASIWQQAVLFTTGDNSAGYTLSEIGIGIPGTTPSAGSMPVVSIYTTASGVPDASLHTLTNPASFTANAVNTFTAPANAALSANTTYAVVFDVSASATQNWGIKETSSTDDDTGAASGWSIADDRKERNRSDTSNAWTTQTNGIPRIEIKGTLGSSGGNNAPTVANEIPDQSVTAGAAFSYAFPANTFADADTGDSLSYTATKSDGTALPSWLSFTASSRTFSGTVPSTLVHGDSVSVKVTASDGTDSVSDTFDIVVNNAPTVANPIPDQSATTGAAFSYAFPANTFNDADAGDTLSYTAAKGDGTALPSWLSFTASTRTFTGTPAAADAGTVSVKVTASDGTASVSDTFDIVVNNAPTVANPIPDRAATAGTAFSYAFPANTFNDADAGDTLSYTATKSDGNALPSWLSFAAGTRTFSGTPQTADIGTLSVKVTASDGTASVSDTFDIVVAATIAPTVANEIPDQSATVGAAFSYAFPANTFHDPDSDTLTYTATKSDGNALPSWLTFTANTRTFAGTPQAADIGTLSVKVTASDGTDSVSDTFDIVVAATIAPTAQAGADRTVEPGATVTLNGSGTDSDGTIQGYAWSQVSGASVTLNNANTARTSFTAPTADGPLVFRLTVTDNAGATDTDDVTVTVRDAPPRFAGGVGTLRLEPGEEMTPVTLPAAAGGNGGPYSYALASAPAGLAGLSFDPATRRLSGTPDAEKGRWTFTYTAHDGDTNRAESDAARLVFQVTVGTAPEAQRRAVKRTVAAVAARTVASALDNIGARLGGGAPVASLTLAGESVPFGASGTDAGLRDAPHDPDPWACPDAGLDGGLGPHGIDGGCAGPRGRDADPGALLPASGFSWTLGAAPGDEGFDPTAPSWSVWGRGDLGSFAGRPEPGMRYRGETRTGWLGVDARGFIGGSKGSRRWVAGLAASRGTSTSDYSFEGGDDPAERGRLETEIDALWPYGRWTLGNGLELRGMAGAGTGRLRHMPGDGEPEERSDLTMRAVSLGLKGKLPPLTGIGHGIDLAARGDASFARMETGKGEQAIDGLSADSWRGRLGLEASRRIAFDDGSTLTPFVETAGRRDGGDGPAGTGLEIAGGVRVAAPRLRVEARGRWLAAHSRRGTEERGVSLTARAGPGADGRGLSMSLQPRWGAGTGGAGALWREELPKGADGGGTAPAGQLKGELGYGFGHFGGRVTGTPNVGFGVSEGGRDYRIGWRLTPAGGGGFRVNLDATRRESAGTGEPAHGAMLTGAMRW